MNIFWAKSYKILCKLAQIFFLHQFKNKIIFNFVIFLATIKGRTTNFFHPSLWLLFLDPESEIREGQKTGSGINISDPRLSRIRNTVVDTENEPQ